ncbi:MFS transporter [Candidatus Wolfebacteria bacterium]|nr:MFS transporter [Candidatus Wolfebacteria bacterium]
MKIKIDINLENFKINRIAKYLILADLFFLGGWSLIDPIFAIFVIQKIAGATIVTVGIATAITLLTKSIFQIPVAIYLDKKAGEKDDFYALVLGLMLTGLTAILFVLTKNIAVLYLIVFLKGMAFGLYVPSWSAIFSRHLDPDRYAFDWSLDSTTAGLAAGVASFTGGILASVWGFEAVFILTSALSFASAFLLFFVPNLIIPRASSQTPIIKNYTPPTLSK